MRFKIYDETAIRNLQLNHKAAELFEEGHLTPPQYEQVKTDFPLTLNQPNLFIRLGLFFFTALCILASIGFVTFWIDSARFGEMGWRMTILAFGIALTLLNEILIPKRRWYRQGSDNAICYTSIFCILGGLLFFYNSYSFSTSSIVSFVFLTIAAMRYGDPLLAFSAFYALILSFVALIDDSQTSPLFLSCIGMMLSFIVYYFSKTAAKNDALFYWEDCFFVLEITGLVALYGFINYYVVDKILFFSIETGIPNPFQWLFVGLTAVLPIIYLVLGIQRKERILWILGTLGIVASILTYRYYYAVMPIEWALTLAGALVLVLAVFLIKYLQIPRNGIAYVPKTNNGNLIESLVMNQILQQAAHTNQSENALKYGGGDFDGGGAGSNF